MSGDNLPPVVVDPERWQRAIDQFLDTVDGQTEATGVREAASIGLRGTAALLGALIATRHVDVVHARVLLEQARLSHESIGRLLETVREALGRLESKGSNGHDGARLERKA